MKSLIKFLIVIVVIAAVAVAGVTFYLDTIAKKAVEYGGTRALGVSTTVDKLHISPLDGSGSINGLTIVNPKGFGAKNFMKLNRAKIAINLKSITSNIIHISEISLAGLSLNLEQSSQASNAREIMANLPESTATAKQAPAASKEKSGSAASNGKKFIVDKLELTDIGVSARLQAMGAQLSDINLTVPQIKLANIGKTQGGLTMPELMQYIVKQVIDAVAHKAGATSPALAAMLQGDIASVEGLKAGAAQAAQAEVDKAAQRLLKKVNIPAGSDPGLQQAADSLVKGLFNSK